MDNDIKILQATLKKQTQEIQKLTQLISEHEKLEVELRRANSFKT